MVKSSDYKKVDLFIKVRQGDAYMANETSTVNRVEDIYKRGEYMSNNPTWHVEDSPWKAKQILKIIMSNDLHPNTICEIGCGAGEILRQMHSVMGNDISFVGYETAPAAFEMCLQRKTSRLDYRLGDLLEDSSAFFDIVMAVDVIEHVEDYFSFLRRLKQKAQYKILHIPLDLSAQVVLRVAPLKIKRKVVGHIHYFTKDIAVDMLSDVGYEVIEFFYTSSTFETRGGSAKSRLLSLPRRIGFKFCPDLTVRAIGGYSLMVLAK